MKEGEQFMSIARLSSYDLQKVIETITIAAIAANTNFFIILSFLIVNIYLNYCLCGFIGEPLMIFTISMPKEDKNTISADYQTDRRYMPKIGIVETGEIVWKYSTKNWRIA
ncbi:hypothetical protein [Segatella hominis]|uniref:Uncharacterized protein n=1 Tax=Segatella hominis TaxID=2518605 RepID=A0A4Y8V5J6_9BACT|nr:hypothetical protein [Segatella hominis]TFH76316.1 hypothetical protein EXN75_14025 [Segatella hominis]